MNAMVEGLAKKLLWGRPKISTLRRVGIFKVNNGILGGKIP
jgi:hypothetical protein